MIRVKLETEQGEHVHWGLMPPFLTLPVVVTWGIRTFTHSATITDHVIYREVFAVAIVADAPDPAQSSLSL